jgi:DNA-directed RNA polymerase subunit D
MEKNKKKFIIKTNESLANAIRRCTNRILIPAIDEVEIYKNDSALYDEVLAHRLGLIPVKENRKLVEPEKCSCKGKGCNKCQIQVKLKTKGPKTVKAIELEGDVEIIYENMPIVILDKNQNLELVGFIRLGKGKNHAKYSPGLVYYRNFTEIKIKDKEEGTKLIEKIKDSLFEELKGNVNVGNIYKSYYDEDYIKSFLDNKNSVEIKDGEELVFLMESWGQLTEKKIFSEAVKCLNSELNEILKAIK